MSKYPVKFPAKTWMQNKSTVITIPKEIANGIAESGSPYVIVEIRPLTQPRVDV